MTEKEKKELEPQLTANAAEKGQSEAQPTAVGKAKAAPRKKKAAKTTGKAGSGTKTRSKAGKKTNPKPRRNTWRNSKRWPKRITAFSPIRKSRTGCRTKTLSP